MKKTTILIFGSIITMILFNIILFLLNPNGINLIEVDGVVTFKELISFISAVFAMFAFALFILTTGDSLMKWWDKK